MVGVFDLGARTFEGIRNASRMEDDDDDDDEAATAEEYSGGDSSPPSDLQQQQQQQMYSSRNLDAIQESSPHGVGGGGGGGGGGGQGALVMSLRARPPRMFGPLGEMDPFTWESAVAAAILRAVVRDDGDLPRERLANIVSYKISSITSYSHTYYYCTM